ncbi:MAG TPA: glycosyltransferase [Solirubrobacteraceae bacterium]|nr:glycosyltransferase [Solirubrobacteraceae bacterium]
MRTDPAHAADVLLVSLGSTAGLRRADDELQDSLRRAGARVAIARPYPTEPLATLMLTDALWARATREAATKILEQQRDAPARAVIYSSTTAALFWRRPGAIRFDATAAGNRRGRHGLWQRPLERRRLRQAPLLLPWSEGGLREAPRAAMRGDRALVLPVPVEASGPLDEERDIAAVTYAANPKKKGLDRVLGAWRQLLAERSDADGPAPELVIAGASAAQLHNAAMVSSGEPGVRVVGSLVPVEFRALLRRARVFVCAPRREDYGIIQLEALADGCQLVTTRAPGPYAALPIASQLDPRLVGDDLLGGLRAALHSPQGDYSERARDALAPFTREAVDRLVAEQLLPRLLA